MQTTCIRSLFVALVVIGFAGCAGAPKVHFTANDFNNAPAGALPSGWSAQITGSGEAKWIIERDDTAPSPPFALKQAGWTPKPSYPLCVKSDTLIKDGFVEVKFKPLAGTNDQAGGLVWRFMDANNYYVVRANALENNVVLYKVEQGKRKALDIKGRTGGYGVAEQVPANQWSTLRVQFHQSRFCVQLNGKELFVVDDSTFPGAGAVGLWTKADSVTLFDDFCYGVK